MLTLCIDLHCVRNIWFLWLLMFPTLSRLVPSNWLHSSYSGRGCISAQQQQILSKQVWSLHLINFYLITSLTRFGLSFHRVSIRETSLQKLSSVCRRVYRILSHAYYHHRELYDEFEVCSFVCHSCNRQTGMHDDNMLLNWRKSQTPDV